MSIAGGRLDLTVAEELSDHRPTFTERESPGGKGVADTRANWTGPGRTSADFQDSILHSGQAWEVAVHSEVVEVSDQASRERCVLDLHRKMPVAPTPFRDRPIEPPQALAPRLAPHLPASAPHN